ncbi:hypothetical protein MNBD_NITROSPINAE01-744 [hydrothermal vent metagenome]|uniref:Cytochrome c domain-containing protein n=1 Tax=hydrothermal vent metagenome TaxID=652676 RepID=A0A3B1BH65_9ZZZZ
MRGVTAGLLASALVCVTFSTSLAGVSEGKQVFLDKGCTNCHTVTALGIESKKMMDAPDLSTVGTRHDGDFLLKFLRKKIDLNGKKHQKKFKGSKADFMKLQKWLLSLK